MYAFACVRTSPRTSVRLMHVMHVDAIDVSGLLQLALLPGAPDPNPARYFDPNIDPQYGSYVMFGPP